MTNKSQTPKSNELSLQKDKKKRNPDKKEKELICEIVHLNKLILKVNEKIFELSDKIY